MGHRRTAREIALQTLYSVEMTGDAYTFVSPDEEGGLRAIERYIGKSLPRQKVVGFDYANRPTERLEIPLAERIATLRKRKAEERARARGKDERRAMPGVPGHGGRTPGSNPTGPGPRRSAKPAPGRSRGEAVLAWARQRTGSEQGPGGGRSHRPGGNGPAFSGRPGFPR